MFEPVDRQQRSCDAGEYFHALPLCDAAQETEGFPYREHKCEIGQCGYSPQPVVQHHAQPPVVLKRKAVAVG